MCVLWLQSALESQALDEKDKAQRLQTELDVSEQVQKDFVKLSQTLQVSSQLMDTTIQFYRLFSRENDTFSWWIFFSHLCLNESTNVGPCPQVQLERIRQADSLDRIKVILNDTNLTDINQLPETWCHWMRTAFSFTPPVSLITGPVTLLIRPFLLPRNHRGRAWRDEDWRGERSLYIKRIMKKNTTKKNVNN